VELFGGPALLKAGDAVSLSPYQLALLTLVYGHEDEGLSRPRAIWLLWEESDDRSLRQRMRQLLHAIRKRAGCDPIRVEGDRLAPALDDFRSDLKSYRKLLSAGELRQAASLHAEGFAAKVPTIPTREYEDWLEAKRQELRRVLREAGAKGWDAHFPEGDWPAAREAAEALYALDPGNESVLRRVIEARAMTGSREAVEAAYAAFLEWLGGERAPARETLELVERVRGLTSTGWSEERSTPEHIPLVGRGEALAKARESFNRVRHGSFEFVLVRGEAGIGKTRLLDELKQEAHVKGFRCLHARLVELEQRIPLNPLLDALTSPEVLEHIDALDEPWRAVIAAVLPAHASLEHVAEVPHIQESSLSRRLLDAFALLFSSLAEERPTLLFIDDLQWADATTLAVLQFVQRRWRAGPLGVVASIRPELVTFADEVGRYLKEPTDLNVTTIALDDLSEEDAIRLVRNVGGEELSQATCARLCALGGRNPFYIIELTKDHLSGRLRLPEMPSDALTIPISLQQLFEARIEHLSDAGRKSAEILSVWARWMKLDDLASLTGMDLEQCAECVEELAGWRLVQEDCNSVRIAHELFRSTIYQRLGDARRSVLHRAVAAHLVATSESPSDSELAIHFARAGHAASAVQHARKAARESLENGAVAEAAHFLELVVANESDVVGKAEATADLARLLHMNREIARANPLLELASVRLRKVDKVGRALRMEIRRVDGLAEVGATSIEDLIDRLSGIKAEARHRDDWEAVALALDVELHLLYRSVDLAGITALFEEMRACAEVGSPKAKCVSQASLALNALFGSPEDGLQAAQTAVRIAEEGGFQEHLLTAQNRLLMVLNCRGMLYLPSAQQVLKNAVREAETSGDWGARFNFAANLGAFYLDAGDLDNAESAMKRAASLLGGAEADVLRVNNLCNLGELAIHRREFSSAAGFFRTAITKLGRNTPPDQAQGAIAGLGRSVLELGRLSEARSLEARLHPYPARWYFDPTLVLTFRARLMERRGEAEEAAHHIQTFSEGLRDRLTLAWLKLRLFEARLRRRIGLQGLVECATEAREIACRLSLSTRAREFQWVLESAPGNDHLHIPDEV